MATGTIHYLGALFLNGNPQPMPTKPRSNGNIPQYTGGPIEIRDTDTSPENQLQWIEVTHNGKTLLICDRVILANVSWDELDARGLIFGREEILDGKKCLLRSLTGSVSANTTDNEWDQFISNILNLPGLPSPNDDSTDKHNQTWNWYNIWTWCQGTALNHFAHRAVRGSISARRWGHGTSSNANATLGWRPVLELLDTDPLRLDEERSAELTGPKTNTPKEQAGKLSPPVFVSILLGKLERLARAARSL